MGSSELTRFAAKQQERSDRSKPATSTGNIPEWRPKKRYDRNACPAGFDADVWDLTLFWVQKREEYGYLGPNRPIVYYELESLVQRSGIKGRGYVDFENKLPGWVKVVRAVIEYFWDWEEEAAKNPEYALDYFCQLPYFNETVDYLLRKAAAERRRKARLEEGN